MPASAGKKKDGSSGLPTNRGEGCALFAEGASRDVLRRVRWRSCRKRSIVIPVNTLVTTRRALRLVGQRTMVYQSDRDIQRGLFAQLMHRKMTLGVYVFNPDDSDNRFAVFSHGAKF